jgi:hypothetical protein
MNHQEAREAYSLKLDGRLPPGELPRLEEHLSSCADCRLFCEELQAAVGALGEIKGIPPVPAGLPRRISQKIAETPGPAPAPWGQWRVPALVFASLAVVVGGTLLLSERPLTSPLSQLPGEFTAVSPAEEKPAPGLSFKSVILFELPASVMEDLAALETALRNVTAARREIVFRGAPRDDSPLDRALAGAGLRDISLTDEAKTILKRRHARLAALKKLKTAGRLAETPSAMLAAAPGVPIAGEERSLMEAENRDRQELLRVFAGRLSRSLGKSEEIIAPALARVYAGALLKVDEAASAADDPEKWGGSE